MAHLLQVTASPWRRWAAGVAPLPLAPAAEPVRRQHRLGIPMVSQSWWGSQYSAQRAVWASPVCRAAESAESQKSRGGGSSRGRHHHRPRGGYRPAATRSPPPPDRQRACTTASPSSGMKPVASEDSAAVGWDYDRVDPITGKTALDELYDASRERIQRILTSPLPRLPHDGSVDPDFFIGFGHYDYRLRDPYRAVIAKGIDVPVHRVRLSVAWSGRFDVKRFSTVQKVCGVVVVPEARGGDAEDGRPPAGGAATLTAEESRRIAKFIGVVNEKQHADLLRMQMVSAAEAIPEVEFQEAQQEYQQMQLLAELLRERHLSPHLAVAIYATEQQRRLVEQRWAKALYYRKIVPSLVSLREMAVDLDQLAGPDSEGQPNATASDDADTTGAAPAGSTEAPGVGAWRALRQSRVCATDDSNGLVAAKEAVVLEALFLHREGSVASRTHATSRGVMSSCGGITELSDRLLPILFLHGAYAGGVDEMGYLMSNKEALDVLLQRPDDVTFKKKLISYMRASHTRMHMAAELDTRQSSG